MSKPLLHVSLFPCLTDVLFGGLLLRCARTQ